MTENHLEHRPVSEASNRRIGPLPVTLLMVGLIAGFFLLREHWAHVAGNWIYLLLLACPLMHLFHGHGRHGASSGKPVDKE